MRQKTARNTSRRDGCQQGLKCVPSIEFPQLRSTFNLASIAFNFQLGLRVLHLVYSRPPAHTSSVFSPSCTSSTLDIFAPIILIISFLFIP